MAHKEELISRVVQLPREPIQRFSEPIQQFLHVEAAAGIFLLVCTVAALYLANSPWSGPFLDFWQTPFGFSLGDYQFRHSLKHWINDGLMILFFFVVGLEVKRELTLGELREFRQALLPMVAALGGMVIPGGLYLALQWGQEGERGWGIPMATDIAFVVGCLALLGSRVPPSLRIFLLSLAIIDDIGAILVIAFGYSAGFQPIWLALAGGVIALLFLIRLLGVRSFYPYILLGILLWFCIHESGVHATIAGVILGLMTPARNYLGEKNFQELLQALANNYFGGQWQQVTHRAEVLSRLQWIFREAVSPVEFLETLLHPWTSFVILPIFALANAGVKLNAGALGQPVALAVLVGLVVGKPLGIFLFSRAIVGLGFARLPQGLTWPVVFAGGCLAGIGFTMALFIAALALEGPLLDVAKIGVLAGSTLAAALGITLLYLWLPKEGQEGLAKPSNSHH